MVSYLEMNSNIIIDKSEDNETLKNVAINYNLSNTLKHDYLLYIEQKIENKDSINIGNYFIYILIFI